MTEPSSDLVGTHVGHYRIDSLIGRGGMGEVYKAHDTVLGRDVALKILPSYLVADADRLGRFVQEARAASALNHPHVVTIYEIGQGIPERDGAPREPGQPVKFIAMELVRGETLRTMIEARRLDQKKGLEYLAQIADGLSAAHAVGIVHRDLKPENVMVTDGGYVKILDFGLAKLREQPALLTEAGDAPTRVASTAPGLVMGTVGYMSPEQAQGRTVDHRSDIFSFGAVLYETVSSRRAFAGASAVDTLHNIIHGETPTLTALLPQAPSELQRIVRKCLAKDPDERFQSIKEVALDLRDLRRQLESGSATAIPLPSSATDLSSRTTARRSPMLWPVLLVMLSAAVLAGLWWLWGRSAEPATSPSITIARLTQSGLVTEAALSPDGKYLAYVESEGGRQSLWLRQVTGTKGLQLVPPAPVGYFGTAFANDSNAVYYVLKGAPPAAEPEGGLYQIPVLGGTPRRILTGIDTTITFSPDGRQFAYLRADYPEPGASVLMVANADGTDGRVLAQRRKPEFFAPGFFVAPSWSPDGARIACPVRNSETRDGHLVTIGVADGVERRLPVRFSSVTFTSWCPDGSGILFVGRELGSFGQGGQIWLQPYPDGPLRRITNDLVEYRSVRVSADGSSLVTVGQDITAAIWILPFGQTGPPGSGPARSTSSFQAVDAQPRKIPSMKYDGMFGLAWMPNGRILFGSAEAKEPQIWTMDADGGTRRQLTTDGWNAWARPSPDGRAIVAFSSRGDAPGLWLMDADGGRARELTRLAGVVDPTMTPDGRWVVFTSTAGGSESAVRVPIAGGPPEIVANLMTRGAVSPDGRAVAGFYRETASSPIVLGVVPIEGGRALHTFPRPVTNTGTVRWTSDGQGLLYTAAERANIWLQPIAGGEPTRVTNFVEGTVFRFDLSPDGRTIVMARGNQSRDAFLIKNFR